MNDHKKKQDSFLACLDRRSLILGTLALLGMATLLAVGLTPRWTHDDTTETGLDRTGALRADCQLIQHLTYAPCGHSLTRRVALPSELAGKSRAELEQAYDLWRVTAFASDEVTMEQHLSLYCPEHLILMADESGLVCVWRNRYGDALALEEDLGIPLNDFSEDVQDHLRAGIGFDDRSALDAWLENAES